MSNLFYWKH